MLCIDLPISSCESLTKTRLIRRWEGGEIAAENKKSSTILLMIYLKIALCEKVKTDRVNNHHYSFSFPRTSFPGNT